MRLAIAAIVLALVLGASARAADSQRPPWISRVAWAIGVCETGKGTSHPDWRHNSGTYEGFVGWYWGTWDLDKRPGYPDHAYQATPRQQNRVMHDSMKKGRHFGCYSGGGYKAWLS